MPNAKNWTQAFWYREERVRTTWRLRFLLLVIAAASLWATRGWWASAVGRGLVCDASLGQADAIVIDNLDINYLLFEHAAQLIQRGMAARVFVPTNAAPDGIQPDLVSAGIVDVMASTARLSGIESVPIREVEPITLNTAYQIEARLLKDHIRSVVIVTPALRSRRSWLVYSTVFGDGAIRSYCAPVFAGDPSEWNHSWHGIEQVVEQYRKLAYYRLYVWPFLLHRGRADVGVRSTPVDPTRTRQ